MSERARPIPPRPRVRVVPWVVGVILLVQYLQWTVVQPADVQGWFAFARVDLDAGRWWAPLTALLVHDRLSLLLLNGYLLLVAGWRLERLWGPARQLAVIAAATLVAAMLHLFLGGAALFFGASAAAFAMLAASVVRWGDEPQLVIGGVMVPSRWLSLLLGTLLLLTGLESGPAFLAHLIGGGIVGAGAMRFLSLPVPRRRARDQVREPVPPVTASTPATGVATTSPSMPHSHPMAANAAPSAPTLDAILDKISAQGLPHLTPEERQILDEHSRRLRDR